MARLRSDAASRDRTRGIDRYDERENGHGRTDPLKAHGRHGATAHDGAPAGRAHENVNGLERLLSVAAGGALAWWGLKRRDWSGLGAGVAAGMLVERGMSGHCAVYEATGLTSASGGRTGLPRRDAGAVVRQHGGQATVDASKAQKIERAFTVHGRTSGELYQYWRRLENLPRIFQHLESVTELDGRRSRWVAKAPAGQTVEWEAEIVNEVPGERIAWKSLPGARVPNAGTVQFRKDPAGHGTEIKVTLEYEPPAGKLGMAIARLMGEEPAVQVREDLRRFKQLMETGEIPVSSIPGQGGDPRETFDAQVNRGATGADVRTLQREAPEKAHEPVHQPAPGDVQRGANTTERPEEVRA